jgi:Gamma tubulin complex component C-terminal
MLSNQMQSESSVSYRTSSVREGGLQNPRHHRIVESSQNPRTKIDVLLETLVNLQSGLLATSREGQRKVQYLKKLLDARVETHWSHDNQFRQRLRDQLSRVQNQARPIQREFLQAKVEDLARKITLKHPNSVKVLKLLLLVSEANYAQSRVRQIVSSRLNPSIMSHPELERLQSDQTEKALSYQPLQESKIPDLRNQSLHASVTAEVLRFYHTCADMNEQDSQKQGYFNAIILDDDIDDPFKEHGYKNEFAENTLLKKQKNNGKPEPLLRMKLSHNLPIVEVYCSITPSLRESEWQLLLELLKMGVMISLIKEYCFKQQTKPYANSLIRVAFISEIKNILQEAAEYFSSLLHSELEKCIPFEPTQTLITSSYTTRANAATDNNSSLLESLRNQLTSSLLCKTITEPTTLMSIYTTISPFTPLFTDLLSLLDSQGQPGKCMLPAPHLLSLLIHQVSAQPSWSTTTANPPTQNSDILAEHSVANTSNRTEVTSSSSGVAWAVRLLRAAAVPFIDACVTWMSHGTLHLTPVHAHVDTAGGDQNQDMFVVSRGKQPVWEEEYEIVRELVPCLFDGDVAMAIWRIGRVRALERKMGFDQASNDSFRAIPGKMDEEILVDPEWLKVDAALRCLPQTRDLEGVKEVLLNYANKRDLSLLARYQEKSGIMSHLNFLRRTMFMKRGDLIENLITALTPILDLPANDVYFHNIMPAFDDVYRKSNLKNTQDQVLGVKLLEPGHGDIGWDIFCIEYKFPEFLQHIFDPNTSLKLLRLWHFLFKIKRCLTKLGEVWLELQLLIRLSANHPAMETLVTEINNYRNHMSQFLGNLGSYIFTEIVENKISNFMKEVTKSGSLHELKERTHKLIDSMLVGAFLERDPLELYKSISFLLNCCFRFCKAFAIASQHCLQEIDERGQVIVKDPSQRLAALDVNRKLKRYRISENFPIASFTTMVTKIWEEYNKSYLRFLVRLDLTPQTRTFSFKFDFNEFHCNSNLEFVHKLYQEEKQKVFSKQGA